MARRSVGREGRRRRRAAATAGEADSGSLWVARRRWLVRARVLVLGATAGRLAGRRQPLLVLVRVRVQVLGRAKSASSAQALLAAAAASRPWSRPCWLVFTLSWLRVRRRRRRVWAGGQAGRQAGGQEGGTSSSSVGCLLVWFQQRPQPSEQEHRRPGEGVVTLGSCSSSQPAASARPPCLARPSLSLDRSSKHPIPRSLPVVISLPLCAHDQPRGEGRASARRGRRCSRRRRDCRQDDFAAPAGRGSDGLNHAQICRRRGGRFRRAAHRDRRTTLSLHSKTVSSDKTATWFLLVRQGHRLTARMEFLGGGLAPPSAAG